MDCLVNLGILGPNSWVKVENRSNISVDGQGLVALSRGSSFNTFNP